LASSTMRSVTASGRKPSVPLVADTAFGSVTLKPEACAVPFCVVAATTA
jgi:hypothetical protein